MAYFQDYLLQLKTTPRLLLKLSIASVVLSWYYPIQGDTNPCALEGGNVEEGHLHFCERSNITLKYPFISWVVLSV